MHKPSSVHSPFICPLPPTPTFLSSPPYSPPLPPTRQFTTSQAPFPRFPSPLSHPSFDSCSFQLPHLYSVNPFHCENVVLQFTLSPLPAAHASPFFSGSLSLLLSVLSFFSIRCARERSTSSSVPLSSRSRHQEKLPAFFSITPFPIKLCLSHAPPREEHPLDFRLFNPP